MEMIGLEFEQGVLLFHAAATWFMVGLIWFVQVVHYPGFGAISEAGFVDYSRAHVQRTGWVVGPPMLLELATAVVLVVIASSAMTWVALGLLAIAWLSTAILQVPAHGRLTEAYDAKMIQRLVATNWIRTLAWSGRGILALYFIR